MIALSLRAALALLSAAARFVPAAVRSQWQEEWSAELQHAAAQFASRRFGAIPLFWMTLGVVRDALVVRGLALVRASDGCSPRRRPVQGVAQDFRYALRGLAASPGFVLGVVGSLSIGMAGTGAAFSLIDAAFFRSYPTVSDQSSLVRVGAQQTDGGRASITYDDYLVVRDNFTSLSGVSAAYAAQFAVSANGDAFSLPGSLVSGNYFEVLGVKPQAGRLFRPDDEASAWTHPAVVIGYSVWRAACRVIPRPSAGSSP
jgi:hypothetical protein